MKKFCNDECRNEFHKHGSAFGPLKGRLETLVKRWTREMEKRLMATIGEQRAATLTQGTLMRTLRDDVENHRKDIAALLSDVVRLDRDIKEINQNP